MVAKMIALFKKPEKPQAFDDKYYGEHIELARQIPGLQLVEISKVNGAPEGEPAFYLMTEFYFDDMDAVKKGMETPEAKAAMQNLKSFAGDITTLLYAEVQEKN